MNLINKNMVAAGLIALAGATTVHADPELQFDVNQLTGIVDGPFSTTYTGDLTLSDDGDSSVLLFINGIFSGYFAAATQFTFAGTISFVNGNVTGGSFLLTDVSSSDTYSATVSPVGHIFTPVSNGPFKVDGFTFSGAFSDNDFDGVDVTDFNGPIVGTFSEILIGPFVNDEDTRTDIDIFGTVIPSPNAALAVIPMLALLATRRRKR